MELSSKCTTSKIFVLWISENGKNIEPDICDCYQDAHAEMEAQYLTILDEHRYDNGVDVFQMDNNRAIIIADGVTRVWQICQYNNPLLINWDNN